MSVALSIAFTGLCALIGDGNGRPGEILLVDTRGVGEVRGMVLPEHAPYLVISLNDLANPETSRPSRVIGGTPNAEGRVDQLGVWSLWGTEIRIRAQGGVSGLRYFQPAAGETSWPQPPADANDAAAWRDLRYVVNMKALTGDDRINPSFLEQAGSAGFPRGVAARVHLEHGLVQGAIPSQETYREELFEFRGEHAGPAPRQAMTDTIEWTLETDSSAIVIEITPVNGGEPKRLLLAPSASPHRVYVSNLPAEDESHDSHANAAIGPEELSALHFGVYYKFLLNKPEDMPLPSVWHPQSDPRSTGLFRPFICPPIVFSAQ